MPLTSSSCGLLLLLLLLLLLWRGICQPSDDTHRNTIRIRILAQSQTILPLHYSVTYRSLVVVTNDVNENDVDDDTTPEQRLPLEDSCVVPVPRHDVVVVVVADPTGS